MRVSSTKKNIRFDRSTVLRIDVYLQFRFFFFSHTSNKCVSFYDGRARISKGHPIADRCSTANQARKMSSINGARQGRSTTVSRGRVHMWTRLGAHHALRSEGGGSARRMRRDGTQRVHNGYVRQGWILLINPTGYIVPPARDGYTPLHPTPPRSRSNEDAPLRRAGASLLLHNPFLDLLFSFVSTSGTRAVSFCRDELCRRVPRRWCASLLYHSHYAC